MLKLKERGVALEKEGRPPKLVTGKPSEFLKEVAPEVESLLPGS
jgi:hypothetical protein